MLGSLSAELLKIRKRWAIRILVVIFVLVLLLLSYVLSYTIYKTRPPRFGENLPRGTTIADLLSALYPPNFHRVALSGAGGLGAAIAIILGVLVAGSEYGWGTYKTIFTQKPSRLTVWLAKFVALVLVSLFLAVLVMVAAAVTSAVLASIVGQALSWPDAWTVVRATGAERLILVVWPGLGGLLAVLSQPSAVGIRARLGFVPVVGSHGVC